MIMKRTSKYSTMAVLTRDEIYSQLLTIKIIQLQSDDSTNNCFAVEYIPNEDFDKFLSEQNGDVLITHIAEPVKTQQEMDLENALDTVLNNDPQSKYNGCTLRTPFDRKDTEWIEWTLKNMHNQYIRSKVELIKNSKYGA